jgi:hypothetical protein
MEINYIEHLLKAFGRVQGLERGAVQGGFLVRGFLLASTLIPIKFLALYTGLCFVFAAVLEVPLGSLADRTSYFKIFVLSEIFYILSNIVFFFFLTSILFEMEDLILIFCVLSGLVQGIASALSSGTSEVIFSNWYRKKLSESDIRVEHCPNLFVGSVWFSLPYRIIVLAFLFLVCFLFRDLLIVEKNSQTFLFMLVPILSLVLIDVIKFFFSLQLLSVRAIDTANEKSNLNGTSRPGSVSFLQTLKEVNFRGTWKEMASIAIYTVTVQVFGVYVTSGAFRFLQPIVEDARNLPERSSKFWMVISSGFITTAGVAFLSALLSRKYRKKNDDSLNTIFKSNIFAILGACLILFVLSSRDNLMPVPIFFTYLISIVVVCSNCIICAGILTWKSIAEDKLKYPATWLSIQSLIVSVGYFLITFFSDQMEFFGNFRFSIAIGIFLLFVSLMLVHIYFFKPKLEKVL